MQHYRLIERGGKEKDTYSKGGWRGRGGGALYMYMYMEVYSAT